MGVGAGVGAGAGAGVGAGAGAPAFTPSLPSAPGTLIRPKPVLLFLLPALLALVYRAFLMPSTLVPGLADSSRAAAPAAIGLACEEPLSAPYCPFGKALVISTPGAAMSGFTNTPLMVLFQLTGPRLLKLATCPLRSTAPTPMASGRLPGLPVLAEVGPKFPMANMGTTPALIMFCTGTMNSSKVPGIPRLMFTMSAPSSVSALLSGSSTYCIPAITCAKVPSLFGRTSALMTLALGATPTVSPTSRPAVCVPWLVVSRVAAPLTRSPSPLNSANAATFPFNCGWLASMPLSRCPILTPCPLNPAAQACGAPIFARCQASPGAAAAALRATARCGLGICTLKFSNTSETNGSCAMRRASTGLRGRKILWSSQRLVACLTFALPRMPAAEPSCATMVFSWARRFLNWARPRSSLGRLKRTITPTFVWSPFCARASRVGERRPASA